MAAITPTKCVEVDCFICQESNLSITHKVKGRKLSKLDFRTKFLDIAGHDLSVDFDYIVDEASVCRSCVKMLLRCHDFRLGMRKSCKSFNKDVRCKRMANFSPQLEEAGECLSIPQGTPEKQCQIQPDAPICQDDHPYAARRKPASQKCLFPDPIGTKGIGLDRHFSRITFTANEYSDAQRAIEDKNIQALAAIPTLRQAVLRNVLLEVDIQTKKLTDRGNPSALLKRKSMMELSKWTSFSSDIIEELNVRAPFLLDILYTVSKPLRKQTPTKIQGRIAAAFSILMFTKDPELSAMQRMLTAICIRGRAEDMAITRLNQIGVTMCTKSKLNLLDECSRSDKKELTEYLTMNSPLLKITGDNLDVYIRSTSQSVNNPNIDLHLFASNAISSRIATMNMDNRKPPEREIPAAEILMDTQSKELLLFSYQHLISKIITEQKVEMKWMECLVPSHMPHAYQREMSTPSKIFQLPIMFCNEAKYEECLNIMDNYETILEDVYTKAHGGIQTLDQIGCVVGGDQLTRVRLEGAKDLRSLSLTKKDRFEHLQPVVCELWHLKVDFLEKLFKTFYKAQSGSQPGTLAYYRNILRKTGVNGKVKSNFQAHSEFIILVTKELIGQQMEEVLEKHPGIIPSNIKEATLETKKKIMASIMDKFKDKFQNSTQQQNSTDDFLYNYTSQLCQWGLHYLAMDDTAKEGDITRIIPNLKRCIPFFFSHSKLSKYLVECINYIVQYEHSSPMKTLSSPTVT